MKTIGFVILVLAIVYLSALFLLYLFQRTLLFQAVGETLGIDREEIVMRHNEVDLKGWVLNQNKQKAIIYFGGNAEQISGNIDVFEDALANYTVYLIDYRGYGRSTGKPTEAGLFADALFIYDQIAAQYDSISVIGRSLGSGVGIYLAANRDIEKLALLTPYDSIAEVAQSHFPIFPTRYLVRDRFDSIRRAKQVTVPILIVTAEFDLVVPNIHADRLMTQFTHSDVSFQMVKNVTHGNIERSDAYRSALLNFFESDELPN